MLKVKNRVLYNKRAQVAGRRAVYSDQRTSLSLTFPLHSESFLDLCEVKHHGQFVDLSAVGQISSRHDGRDAQLLLQNAEGQLVVVKSVGLIQRGHVSVEERNISHYSSQ